MKLTIHQIEFMSYLGFWEKITKADKFVILDDVPFRKNYFQNRNQILMNGNPNWFGIEVQKSTNTPIKEVKVSPAYNPTKKVKTIEQAYKKAPHFDKYAQGIVDILKQRHEYLIEYNFKLFLLIRDYLGLDLQEVICQSKENYVGHKSDLLLNICLTEGADTYLAGKSGIDYLDLSKFAEAGIGVDIQNYVHPKYSQLKTQKFTPFMSIIDLLFNEGPNSLNILKNGRQ